MERPMMKYFARLFLLLIPSTFLVMAFQNFIWPGQSNLPGAKHCSADKIREILTPASQSTPTVKVDCSFSIRKNETITKGLILEGPNASGVAINCQGGALTANSSNTTSPRLIITSDKNDQRPLGISIENCNITGTTRLIGLGKNGEAPKIRASSYRDQKHTQRAQAAAPNKIFFESIRFIGNGGIPLYIGPGSTEIMVQNSVFVGQSNSVAIYMDAESALNQIVSNKFQIKTGREVIAIDGSAKNQFRNNKFSPQNQASIHLYRNCGEGGTVRHQTPSENLISGNIFYQDQKESIHVGSRNSRSSYCSHDSGYPFGSSQDDADNPLNNVIVGNQFILNYSQKGIISRYAIVTTSATTQLGQNRISMDTPDLKDFSDRVAGAYTDLGKNAIERLRRLYTQMTFECKGSSKAGCLKEVKCPRNKKIISAKAGCNLEGSHSLYWPQIKSLKDNEISVFNVADKPSNTKCQLGGTQIYKAKATVTALSGNSVKVGCQGSGSSGVQCLIRGVLTCEI